MLRVALRGIRSHFVRFALAVLAVALGVAFVAGTYSLRAILASTFDGIVDGAAAGQAYLRGTDDGTASMDEFGGTSTRERIPATLADDVADVPGVASAIPDYSGALVLVGADGAAVSTTGAPSAGIGLFPDDPSLTLIDGELPERGEIALETGALEASGLQVGDETTVVIRDAIEQVTVSGELDFGTSAAGAILVGLDPDVAAELYAPEGTVSTIAVFAEDGVSETELRDALAERLAGTPGLEVITGEVLREEFGEQIDMVLGFIQVFLLTFAAVSVFVGAFLITNTFAMSVRERMREFAMLRAVGASPGQVFVSILVQALVIGLLGSVVGIAAGLGLAAGLAALLGNFGMELSGSVELSTDTVVVSLLIGIVVSVVAAAIPARRAALTPPVVAMRGDAPSERGLRLRGIVGAVLAVVGGALVAYAGLAKTVEGDAVDGAGTFLGIGAALLVVGVLVLAPSLARPAVTALAAPVVAGAKPLGALARGNVVRNPRRTASTAGALMIGMTLVSAASIVAASATTSIESMVSSDLKADFLVQGPAVLPGPVLEGISELDSARLVDPISFGITTLPDAEDPTTVVGVSDTLFTESIAAKVHEGDVASIAEGDVLVTRDFAEDQGWVLGDTIPLGPDGDEARIGGLVTVQALFAQVFVPQALFDDVIPAGQGQLAAVFVTAADGVTPDALRADLAEVVKPYYVLSVLDADDLVDQLAGQINGMLAVIYALLGLSVVIAVLGIVNTLALSIIERTREIALLRAVGLGRLQLAGMVAIESVLTAVFGTILGVGVGVGIATALPAVLADSGLTDLVIPWGTLLGMVVLAAIIGLFASLWPAWRATRQPVLQGLAAE